MERPARRVAEVVAVGSACVCAGVLALGAAAANVPNPCKLLPSATIASTLGLRGVTLTGTLSSRPNGLVTQRLCTFVHGATKIQIEIAPHQVSGGSGGGGPGMQSAKPSGLGASASDYYDTEAKFAFANVDFTHGGYDAGVYDSGSIPNGSMVALARLVYRAVG